MQNIKFIIAAVVIFAFAACKPSAGSDGAQVKTLDNFTRADGAAVTTNRCGMKMTEDKYRLVPAKERGKLDRHIKAPNDMLKRHVAGALVAVPKALQSMFFAANGLIQVTPQAESLCSKAGMSASEREFAGEHSSKPKACWRSSGNVVEIIVKDDVDLIHHSLVRMFAYLYTQFFEERFGNLTATDSAIAGKIKSGLARLKKQKAALASALLKDLSSGDRKVFEKFVQFDIRDSANFENFVLAETMDSYYCSKKTGQVMRRNFDTTYKVFTRGSGDVPGLAGDFGAPWHE